MSDFPTAMYNPVSPGPLATIIGLTLLALAGIALWRSRQLDSVNTYARNAAFFGVVGVVSITTGVHIMLMDIRLDEGRYGDQFTVPGVLTIVMSLMVSGAMITSTIDAIRRRKAVQTAAAITGLFAAGTVVSYVMLFRFLLVMEEWAVVTTVFWYLTVLSLIALAATVAVVQIRAYGKRQFDRGARVGIINPHRVPGGQPVGRV